MITYNYAFFKDLFDIGWVGIKKPFFNCAQKVFQLYYEPKGLWKQHPTDPKKKFGHVDENGEWHWSNRANTNSKFCMFMYYECIGVDPKFFIDFGNPKYHNENSKRIWYYISENFEDYFEPYGKKYKKVRRIFEKSWAEGVISSIALEIALRSIYRDILKIDYSFENGDSDDMEGIDMSVFKNDGGKKTIQIKSGSFIEIYDEFIVQGAPNDLKYTTDWYAYVNVDLHLTRFIIFKNTKNLKKEDGSTRIHIPKEDVIKYGELDMKLPQLLKAIMEKCGKLDISFTITKIGDESYIEQDNESNTITINIVDSMDKEFPIELKKFLEELK